MGRTSGKKKQVERERFVFTQHGGCTSVVMREMKGACYGDKVWGDSSSHPTSCASSMRAWSR